MDATLIAKALLYELQTALCNCDAGSNGFMGDLSNPDAHHVNCEYRIVLGIIAGACDGVTMDDFKTLAS